jgi:hypothetical protein
MKIPEKVIVVDLVKKIVSSQNLSIRHRVYKSLQFDVMVQFTPHTLPP